MLAPSIKGFIFFILCDVFDDARHVLTRSRECVCVCVFVGLSQGVDFPPRGETLLAYHLLPTRQTSEVTHSVHVEALTSGSNFTYGGYEKSTHPCSNASVILQKEKTKLDRFKTFPTINMTDIYANEGKRTRQRQK